MEFQKYKKSEAGRGGTGPRISLRKSASIGLNGAAIDEFFADTEWVTLYFSEEGEAMGIRPESQSLPDSYKLQKRETQESKGGSISATSFMREYGLIPNKTEQYRAQWSEDQGLVIAELNDPVLVYED